MPARAAFFAAILLAAGCADRTPPEALFRHIDGLRRAGDLNAALEQAQRASRRFRAPDSRWYWEARLLEAEVQLDRGASREALRLLQQAGGPADPALRARRLAALADARSRMARTSAEKSAALDLSDRALEAARANQGPALLAGVYLRRANLKNEFAHTESCYRRMLEYAGLAKDPYLLAAAYAGLGFVRWKYTRYDEAIPFYEAAQTIARGCGARRILANALSNLGSCYLRLGDFDHAQGLLERVISEARQGGDLRSVQFGLWTLAQLLERRGAHAAARQRFTEAAAMAEQRQDIDALAGIWTQTAEAAFDVGETAAARDFNGRAVKLLAGLNLPHSLIKNTVLDARIDRSEEELRAAAGAALQLNETTALLDAHAALAAHYRGAGRGADADAEYRAAIGVIQDAWTGLLRDTSKVTYLSGLIRFYQDYVDFLMDRGEAAEALAAAESARARLMAEKLGLDPTRPLPLAAIQRALRRSGATALVYWVAPKRSFAWVVTGSRVSARVLPPAAEIDDAVQGYSRLILARHDLLARDYPARDRMYRAVLAPVCNLIPQGAQVILVPDGELHRLDFDTLIAPEKPHYWIEDAAVTVVPSLDVLRFGGRARREPSSVLFIGDPDAADPQYPPLPHLKDELAVIHRLFPKADVYRGAEAVPSAYAAASPQRYAMIHFAAHGVPNAEAPLESAIVLSRQGEQYKLYAKDVMDVPIRASLVTVSVCSGAGGRAYSGEGLMGFAWAFLETGARNVLAGLWPVDDAATAQLMASVYGALAHGAPPAEALRHAKLAMLKSDSVYRRPYYWGAFEVFSRETEPLK